MGPHDPVGPVDSFGKDDVRSAGLRARRALDDDTRAAATGAVIAELQRYRRRRQFTTLCAYAATGTELVLDRWLREVMAEGVGVFLPLVRGDHLELFRVRDLDAELVPGDRGIRQPQPAGRRPARVDRIDTFLVPGAAFDPRGNRVGYGGGHFDRLLAMAHPRACRIGVAFEVQILDAVPNEPHDVALHAVVTERRAIATC